ncbi:MAG: adenylosuccinate synthase [bacterium]
MNTVVIGTQWGDEGKGKIVDLLTEEADCVVRYQGGHNAGHTVVIKGEKYILHLIPSGIMHPGRICLIGSGAVIDPKALFNEIDMLTRRGINLKGRIFVSESAHVIMPYHQAIDVLTETAKKGKKIGTTGLGIGPAYTDKYARIGIRIGDLFDESVFIERLDFNLRMKNFLLRKMYRHPGFNKKKILKEYLEYAKRIKEIACDISLLLNNFINEGKNILFEGAQGTMLDIDWGTYPYVTSSNATIGGLFTGLGIDPRRIDRIMGVSKAYTTRVGEGPMLTEFPLGMQEKMRDEGKEFGATTGRPRRCGWFDAVVVRYAVRINGINEICLTKLDILDKLKTIKVCTGYRYKNKILKEFPGQMGVLSLCKPVYEELPGWEESLSGRKYYNELPDNTKKYIKKIEELVGVKVSLISVGEGREQSIDKD